MAYDTLVTSDFLNTPYIGTLPENDKEPMHYDIRQILIDAGVSDPSKVSEILVYGFFTGLASANPKLCTIRAVYEIYTKPAPSAGAAEAHYSQLMNATFNQLDTVINSANLWIPYTSEGVLYARIPAHWITPGAKDIPRPRRKYKNLDEAMKAYAKGEETTFKDLYLLGYRLKQ